MSYIICILRRHSLGLEISDSLFGLVARAHDLLLFLADEAAMHAGQLFERLLARALLLAKLVLKIADPITGRLLLALNCLSITRSSITNSINKNKTHYIYLNVEMNLESIRCVLELLADATQLLILGSDELRVLRVDLVELASALLFDFVQSFD